MISDLLLELARHTKALQADRTGVDAVLEHLEVEKAVAAQVSRRTECDADCSQ
jgi:hypothetical protein